MIEVARLHRVDAGKPLKAFADVVINGLVLVKGVRVISGKNENLFVSMPMTKGKNSKWYESVEIVDKEIKQELQEAVLAAYQN